MSDIFNIERNDECICGSGKKYKKCCLPAVEKIDTYLLKAIGRTEGITAYGRDFIRIISVMYGIKFKEKESTADVEKLATLIIQAWKEEEEIFANKLEELNNEIAELLREKKELKYFRIPGALLADTDFNDEEQMDGLLEEISDKFSFENYLLDLAYSLRTDEYTKEELKIVFHWIFLGMMDETSKGFIIPILRASLEDIANAKEKLEETIGNKDRLDQEDITEIFKINAEYPVFEEYFGSKMLQDVQEELDDVFNSEIDFNFPFFAIYAFYLKLFAKIIEVFSGIASHRNANLDSFDLFFGALDEVFQQNMVFVEIYTCISKTIIEMEEKTQNEDLKNKLTKIRKFFSILTTTHFHVIKRIFIISMIKYLKKLPQQADDSGIVVESLDQLTSREFFDKYVSYLESKGLNEKAGYIKELYGEIENEQSNIVKNPQKIFNAILQSEHLNATTD